MTRWSMALGIPLLIVLVLGAARLDDESTQAPVARERAEVVGFTLGTVVRIVAEGEGAEAAAAAAMAELEHLSGLLDRFLPESDVARINAANGAWTQVSPATWRVIQRSVELAKSTAGIFDPTVAPLVDLWGFVEAEAGQEGSGAPSSMVGLEPPPTAEVALNQGLVDYRGVVLDREAAAVRLERSGQALDLGGVAKGYGADRAAAVLRSHGITDGLVDVGGDVYALGTRSNGDPWRLGVQHPRDKSTVLAIVHVSDQAVSTSGDYERYFEYEQQRYAHILDPTTGWPATGMAGATVIAASGLDADALSTAVFVLGMQQGLALLESLPGVDGLLVDTELNVAVTSGLQGRIDLRP